MRYNALLLMVAFCAILGPLGAQNLMFTHNPSRPCGTYTASAYCATCTYHYVYSECTIQPDVCFEDRFYRNGYFYGDNNSASAKRTGITVKFTTSGTLYISKGIPWAPVSGSAGQQISIHLDELTWYPCQPVFDNCISGPECKIKFEAGPAIKVITSHTPGGHGYLYDLKNVNMF